MYLFFLILIFCYYLYLISSSFLSSSSSEQYLYLYTCIDFLAGSITHTTPTHTDSILYYIIYKKKRENYNIPDPLFVTAAIPVAGAPLTTTTTTTTTTTKTHAGINLLSSKITGQDSAATSCYSARTLRPRIFIFTKFRACIPHTTMEEF